MNYIDLLTKDEQAVLCEMITGRNFKGYFEKYQKAFSKMKKGFRAKSLSNEAALETAIDHIHEPFIFNWINDGVAFHLENIQENVEIFENEGLEHDNALAKALMDSFFADNVGLYLKLSGNNSDADYAALLVKKMKEIEAERVKEIETNERIKKLEEEKTRLQEQIKDGQAQMEAAKETYEQRLQEVEQKKESLKDSLAAAQAELANAKAENERIAAAAAEKEKLAENVETAVVDRIQKFIANMAFAGGQPAPNTSDAVGNGADIGSTPYRVIPQRDDLDENAAHYSWDEVVETVKYNLRFAGVSGNREKGLAAYLYAAYIKKQPILLAGPNAIDIAQAFSAAVTGQQCGVLACEGRYNERIVESIGAAGEKIVVTNNLFASEWMNRLPEILAKKNIFFIITHPYAEDIRVEPKSLYGYMLPLFTEFFVDHKADGEYYGGYSAPDFEEYNPKKSSGKKMKGLSKLSLTPLTKNRMETILETMHDIFPGATNDDTNDDDFVLGILPMAYALMKMDELTEMVSGQQITVSDNLKRDLRYILGDI